MALQAIGRIRRRVGLQKIFYGWWIAVGAFLLNLINGGAFTYGFSLFITPLADAFGWSRSSISIVWSSALLVSLLLGPLVGLLIDRHGGRRMVWIGLPAFGFAYIVMGHIQQYWLFLPAEALLLGFGLATGVNAPGDAEVAYWFRRRRAYAIGLATAGTGFAGVTIVPIVAWMIAIHGWRTTTSILGIAVMAVALPLGFIFKGRPEAHGEYVDGVPPEQPVVGGTPRIRADEPTYSAREAFHTPVFWLLNIAFGLRWLGIAIVSVHQVPYLVSIGFSHEVAPPALGGALLISTPSRLIFGWIGDRTNVRLWLILSYILQGSSLIILMSAGPRWTLYVYALLFGLGGAALPLSSALIGEYFGRRNYATIQGIGRPFGQLSRVLGALIGGIVFDVTGSYRVAFLSTGLVLNQETSSEWRWGS